MRGRLLDIYGITEGEERELLLTLARESRERGWWQQYGEAIPEWFATYVGLEAEASTISVYQAEIVPGLLQTERYAAALHRAALMNATEEEIARHVAVRMERQARLKQPDAPQLWVVLNEAVIRRVVGERAVMHEQLVELAEAASAPNITLQVLPFSAGAHASMDSAFWIVGFDPPTDGEIVYLEHPTCSLYLEKPEEVARYRLVYEHLRAASLSFDESTAADRAKCRGSGLGRRRRCEGGHRPASCRLAQVHLQQRQRGRLRGSCAQPPWHRRRP